MHARTWILTTLGLILLAVTAVVSLNATVDIYGLFRDPRGRHLVVYGDERIAKYLLCSRYVPANFNAILVGSSVTANWNTGRIDALRVYNASLNGGNIVEESCLVDSALSRPGVRTALLVVHPFLTRSHNFETVLLTPRERTAALGSLSLWAAYKEKLKVRFLHGRQVVDEFGTNDFPPPANGLNPILQRMMRPDESFELDPVAIAAYAETIAKLHDRNIRIAFVVPPLYEGYLNPKKEAFHAYLEQFRGQMTAQDTVIDFNSEEYAAFRRDRCNFSDGVHVMREGAQVIVAALNVKLKTWLAETAPPAQPRSGAQAVAKPQ